jgi:hypothetical protein
MKSINEYITEARLGSANLSDLKDKLKKMSKGDRIDFLYGIRQKATDATGLDRIVSSVMSIDKIGDDKYQFCTDFTFKKGHEMIDKICKELKIKRFARLLDIAIVVDYEDMCNILDVMPKYIESYTKANDEKSLWYHITFDPKEAEAECAKQKVPFEISSLEDEIKRIESEIGTLEDKKAKLKELKELQGKESDWNWEGSE